MRICSLYREFSAVLQDPCQYHLINSPKYIFSDFKKVHPTFSPLSKISQDNFAYEFRNKKNKVFFNLLSEVSILHSSYRNLCNILEQIDRYFSFQLLLSIAECNLNVLINMYFAIFGGYYKPEDKTKYPQSPTDILNDFIWGMYYLIRFFAISLFASFVVNEVCMNCIYIIFH